MFPAQGEIMNKLYISTRMNKERIEHKYTWLNKDDGCYLRCRIVNTNDALLFLMPLDNEEDEMFCDYCIGKIKQVIQSKVLNFPPPANIIFKCGLNNAYKQLRGKYE